MQLLLVVKETLSVQLDKKQDSECILSILVSPQIVEEHCSVEQSRRAQAEPISLDSCLKAFTGEEELGEDELYYCSKCKTHRLATKKLDLWRLPPILVSVMSVLSSGLAGKRGFQ